MAMCKYALFYDFHTAPDIPSAGEKFNADEFTEQIKTCGVDFLTFHARCNQGNAYYNTKVGYKHPALNYDMFGALAKACFQKGIKLSAYFNIALSEEELIRHRDWLCIFNDGRAYHENNGPWMRIACYNSPYREHLKKMVLEVVNNYPISGFFFDCVMDFPCICNYCMDEMKKLNYDFRNKEEILKFNSFSANRLCKELESEIHNIKPDALLFFNGRTHEKAIEWESHLECECLPTSDLWGYEYLPVMAHYMRNIAKNKTVLNMTGRFHEWGDFGGLRSREGLEYDMFYGIANGMRPDIGDHLHPSGKFETSIFERIREVYYELQFYDEWVLDAVNFCEVAIIHQNPEKELAANNSLKAAVRMLDELKIQFDLLPDFDHLDSYRLLILPDCIRISSADSEKLNAYLEQGGALIASAHSGLRNDSDQFSIAQWPGKYVGEIANSPLYFFPEGRLSANLPTMPLGVYSSGIRIVPNEGAVIELFAAASYFNRGWDGVHTHYYTPPAEKSQEPFALRKNNILYFTGAIFTGYAEKAALHLKKLLANSIEMLFPKTKVQYSNLPAFSRVFVQRKNAFELIHILAYCPEKRNLAFSIEDRLTIADAEISLRLDGRTVKNVSLAPNKLICKYTCDGDYCHIQLPILKGYALVLIEYQTGESFY